MTDQEIIKVARVLKEWCERNHEHLEPCQCPFANAMEECVLNLSIPKYWLYEDDEHGEV